MLATTLGLLFGSVLFAILSDGVHHDDDLVHFLMARWSWTHWEYLLHPWGRPGLTIPMAAVAGLADVDIGWRLARVASAVVTAGGAWLAADLARRLGVRSAWIVVVACYLQPLNAVLSYTTLTENFAAFYLVAAASLLTRRRLLTASTVFSLALVTRHELIVLLPIWLGAVWMGRFRTPGCVLATLATVSALVLYNVAFYALLGDWPLRLYADSTGSTQYTAAGLFSYLPHLFYAITPTLVGLACVGGVSMVRRGRLLVPAIAGAYLATHLLLRAFGLFASGGFGRFMVTVAPFTAILCVEGVWQLAENVRSPRQARGGWLILAAVFATASLAITIEGRAGRITLPVGAMRWIVMALPLLPALACFCAAMRCATRPARRLAWSVGLFLGLLCILQWAAIVRPLALHGWPIRVREVVTWLDGQGLADRPIFAATPWVAYWKRQIEMPRLDKGPELLASMPVGTVVIWDSLYSPSDFHRLPRTELDGDPAYHLIAEFQSRSTTDDGTIAVYEKVAATPQPAHAKEPYPPNLMIRQGRVSGVYCTPDK